jgi:hypothetical protein
VIGLVFVGSWTVYANIFAAGPYPQLGNASFDAPIARSASEVVASRWPESMDNARVASLEPPAISAPETVPPETTLTFLDRFSAASPQGVAPAPVPEPVKLAEASKPKTESVRTAEAPRVEAPRTKETARIQLASAAPTARQAEPANNEAQAPKTAGDSIRDMAQRAKSAILSIGSADRSAITEKLWGKGSSSRNPVLAYASADASATGSIGPRQNPALGGSAPYDRETAVYDISAHTVYLPDGSKLEAHSGLGDKLDDPRSASIRMRGVTPPHMYELTPRESLFHGVAALRLNPVGGEDTIYGRSGLLAHTFMLGSHGDSNGCVSFRDYNAFLNAYRNQGIRKLAVVARID